MGLLAFVIVVIIFVGLFAHTHTHIASRRFIGGCLPLVHFDTTGERENGMDMVIGLRRKMRWILLFDEVVGTILDKSVSPLPFSVTLYH